MLLKDYNHIGKYGQWKVYQTSAASFNDLFNT